MASRCTHLCSWSCWKAFSNCSLPTELNTDCLARFWDLLQYVPNLSFQKCPLYTYPNCSQTPLMSLSFSFSRMLHLPRIPTYQNLPNFEGPLSQTSASLCIFFWSPRWLLFLPMLSLSHLLVHSLLWLHSLAFSYRSLIHLSTSVSPVSSRNSSELDNLLSVGLPFYRFFPKISHY